MALHYLTVQDILWINLQVTKKVEHFNYALLEEAVFYQYAYGDSKTLTPQAGRFISGFLKLHPFDAGNEATAFVACLAFLKINGWDTTMTASDARSWFEQVQSKRLEGAAAIEGIAKPAEDDHGHAVLAPNVRTTVKHILAEHAELLESLANPQAA